MTVRVLKEWIPGACGYHSLRNNAISCPASFGNALSGQVIALGLAQILPSDTAEFLFTCAWLAVEREAEQTS
ncbi:hypothetical protein [Flavipsychrobacter stenotrophus]|uniref:hypothetical protein n=1 Tax=Flavipsychrobacter stenotrophus TaxID=2077091 RepID=UPI0010575166|nr:hypothetical protein [Flavipsychrobacter stenotrophus]